MSWLCRNCDGHWLTQTAALQHQCQIPVEKREIPMMHGNDPLPKIDPRDAEIAALKREVEWTRAETAAQLIDRMATQLVERDAEIARLRDRVTQAAVDAMRNPRGVN